MQAEIRSDNLPLSDAVREHVHRRIDQALDRFRDRIGPVTVTLSDVNAGRGGVDKRCHLRTSIRGGGSVMVAHLDGDLYAAIDLATTRLKDAIRRRLERQSDPGRKAKDLVSL